MTFIFTAAVNGTNPIGNNPFTGPLFNITNPTPTCLFSMLKSALKTSGFRVIASGDGNGSTLYDPLGLAGDVFTNDTITTPGTLNTGGGLVAFSTNNNLCWFVVVPPAGAPNQIQIGFQQGDSVGNPGFMRIKVSCDTFNVSGPLVSNQLPGVTGGNTEVIIWGGGTDAVPSGHAVLGAASGYRINIGVDNTAATARFWVSTWAINTNTPLFYCYLTQATVASLTPGDTYRYLCGANIGCVQVLTASSGLLVDTPQYGAATRFSTGPTTKVSAQFLTMSGEPGIGQFQANTLTGKEDILPMFWGRPQSAAGGPPYGVKGVDTMMRWRGAPHDNADNVSIAGATTYEFITVNDGLTAWEMSGVAGVR